MGEMDLSSPVRTYEHMANISISGTCVVLTSLPMSDSRNIGHWWFNAVV